MMVAENDGVFLFEAKTSEHVFFKQNPSKVPVFFCVNTWFLNPNTTTPQTSNHFGVCPGNVQVQVVESQLRDAGGSLDFKGRGGWGS